LFESQVIEAKQQIKPRSRSISENTTNN